MVVTLVDDVAEGVQTAAEDVSGGSDTVSVVTDTCVVTSSDFTCGEDETDFAETLAGATLVVDFAVDVETAVTGADVAGLADVIGVVMEPASDLVVDEGPAWTIFTEAAVVTVSAVG